MARDNSRVLFEHGGSVVTLEGRATEALLPTLLPLLDGTRTFAEIVETLGHAAEPSIARALESLAEGGLLTDGPELRVGPDSAPTAAAAAFVAAATRRTTPRAALAALTAADVAVAGESPDGAEIVRIAAHAGLEQVRRVALAEPLAGQTFSSAHRRRARSRSCPPSTLRGSPTAALGCRSCPTTGGRSLSARSTFRASRPATPATGLGGQRPPATRRTTSSSRPSQRGLRARQRCRLWRRGSS